MIHINGTLNYRTVRSLAVALTLMVFQPALATAQSELAPDEGFGDRPRLAIGYVTNAPNMFAGVSVYGLFDALGGIGLYVDAKRSLQSPEDESDFVDDFTVSDAEALPGQQFNQEEFAWWSLNAAILRPLSPELMVYLGAGYTSENRYARYLDTTNSLGLGSFGYYWAHDPQESGGRINVLGGMFFRISRAMAVQFGLESAPRGLTVGLSYSLGL